MKLVRPKPVRPNRIVLAGVGGSLGAGLRWQPAGCVQGRGPGSTDQGVHLVHPLGIHDHSKDWTGLCAAEGPLGGKPVPADPLPVEALG
eukprot:6533925-Lingulodinium_polyedra.AAC.1